MRILFCFFSSMFLFLNTCKGETPSIALVQEGKTSSIIVLTKDAPAVDRKAATILQDYVKKISGAWIPIVTTTADDRQKATIRIGASATEYHGKMPIEKDGFVLRVEGNQLLIFGGAGKGVLYAVYTLLEEYFGCRKWDEGSTIVPQSKNLTLPGDLNRKEVPVLAYRESFYPAAMDNEYLDWHKLHRFEDLWGLWGHSFFKLLPPQHYFKDHPEYFAEVNGRRQATQLCLTNKNVERIVVENLKQAISDNPDATYWSLAPMDGSGFCTCDQCLKVDEEEGGHQGTLIRFVNKVAQQFPDKTITTLAYTFTANPPRKTKPLDNVYVMLSSIDAQRQKALLDEPTAKVFRDQLEGWKSIGTNLFVWDYTTQFTNYLAPFPDYANLQPNIAYFVEQGIGGVFSQGSGYTYGDAAELKSYLLAKTLWNPEIDIAKVREEFIASYYGDAKNEVTSYLNALQHTVRETHAVLDIYGNPVNSRKDYLSPAHIDQYSQYLDKAEASVESDDTRTVRVARLRLGLEYTVLQQARLYGREQYGFLVEDDVCGGLMVKPDWSARIDRFVQASTKAKVTELSEGGVSPQAYANEWKELLKQAWIPGVSVDKKVKLLTPFVPDYPAKREETLTDGMAGGTDYSFNWLLFEAVDLVADIDLGKPITVKELLINYLDDPKHYILAPIALEVAWSEDGKTFKSANHMKTTGFSQDMEVRPIRRTIRLTIPNQPQARFVRVTAKNPKSLPAWFTGSAARKPLIAIDEITVR